MKLFGYAIDVWPHNWESYSYSGVVIANTLEEAIGMIIQESPDSNRKNFTNGEGCIDPESIWEIDTNEVGVHLLGFDRFEE